MLIVDIILTIALVAGIGLLFFMFRRAVVQTIELHKACSLLTDELSMIFERLGKMDKNLQSMNALYPDRYEDVLTELNAIYVASVDSKNIENAGKIIQGYERRLL